MTEEQINEAWELRNAGISWERIGYRFNVSRNLLRRLIDPKWAELRRKANRAKMRDQRSAMSPGQRFSMSSGYHVEVPECVMSERDYAFSIAPSLSQTIFGDPPFSRSALGRKLQNV